MTFKPDNNDPAELDALAGEYVLGTLDAPQRRAIEQRLRHDGQLQAAVGRWEARLLPLNDLVPPQTPSAQLWPRIERSLNALNEPAPQARQPAGPSWWNLLPLWRGLTAAGLAATLVLGTVLLTTAPTVPPPAYVVVLVAPQNQAPGWVIQASNRQQIQLIPLGMAQVPADKALEFWTKGKGWDGPVSLGLVKPGQTLSIPLDSLPPLEPDQLFELTLEGPNGSPLGKPTGPIQFIGRAVKVI